MTLNETNCELINGKRMKKWNRITIKQMFRIGRESRSKEYTTHENLNN